MALHEHPAVYLPENITEEKSVTFALQFLKFSRFKQLRCYEYILQLPYSAGGGSSCDTPTVFSSDTTHPDYLGSQLPQITEI
jgi:hypothetical protein